MADNNGGGSNDAVVAIFVIFVIIVAAALFFFGGQFFGGSRGGETKKVDINIKAPVCLQNRPNEAKLGCRDNRRENRELIYRNQSCDRRGGPASS